MHFNWIDGVIAFGVVYAVVSGWKYGVIRQLADLISFLGSLWLAVRWHNQVGDFFVAKFGLPSVWAEVLGYVAAAMGAELVLVSLVGAVALKLPVKWWESKWNQILGIGVSGINGMVISAFIMLVIVALPIRGSVKKDIAGSVIGSRLVRVAERYGGEVKSSLDRAAKEAIRFLTVKPGSGEEVSLATILPAECERRIDEAAEVQIVQMVNLEREKVGVKSLAVDPKIIPVARGHSQDMLNRKYFAHASPEGETVVERMEKGGVKFFLAGENLALAYDVATAHRGLMESEGHRKNILESRFGRVGIGIIDGGNCGLMVTQNFAD